MRNIYSKTRILVAVLIAQGAIAYANGSDELVDADRRGRALEGRDVVAYFSLESSGEAVVGIESYTYEWNGASWWFSNSENLETFQADPERFAPKYGGYCSMAMAKDKVVHANPDAWTIRDGTLYLFARKAGRKTWRDDPPQYIALADGHWANHVAQLAESIE